VSEDRGGGTGDGGTSDGRVEATLDTDALRSRARWVQVALIVVAIIDLIAIGSDYAEYRLLGPITRSRKPMPTPSARV
jgi:hypothetical protein